MTVLITLIVKAVKSKTLCGLILARSTIIHFKRKETIMKTFSEISNQLERIYKLYLKGFGTKKMLETAERFFNSQQNIGLCF